MKPVFLSSAVAAAMVLATGAEAKQRPVWEVGVGGGVSYSADYWGAGNSGVTPFPLAYFSYRGEDFSIIPNGLYDVPAYNTDRFGFSASVDFRGSIEPEDRLGLPEIDYVGEFGPQLEIALYADGQTRLHVALAARASFELGNGYIGYVIEPELHFMTTLSETTRLGISAEPKFGFDGYNQLYYSTPGFDAADGYLGTEFALRLVNDVTDRVRIAGKLAVIALGESEIQNSPLTSEDTAVDARISVTYALFQSDEMTDN